MKVSKIERNVFQVKIDYEPRKDWSQYMLLSGDRHWDNPKSDLELQLQHLEEAKERNAKVIDVGDLFCVMQGKYDRRSDKSSLRPEHQKTDYLDSVVRTAADFFEPYASQFLVIASGNHEQSIEDRHETSLIERLCARLRDRTGAEIYHGGYSGWVIFSFTGKNNKSKVKGSGANRIVLHYDHGFGGGSPVTSDMPSHFRRAAYLPDAHIVISGHTHGSWTRDISRVRLNRAGRIEHDCQTHVKLPTYKEEYRDGFSGWHARTGKPPKPIGAAWLRFYYNIKKQRIMYDVTRAK